jgi:hypothetical protein
VQSETDPAKKLIRHVSKPIGQTGAVAVAAAVSELVEIDIAASQGSATATVCYGENDQWDQDGPKCFPAQTVRDGVVTIRHIPTEPEIVTVYVTSQGAPEGTFTITTRGDYLSKGSDALARLERMADKAYIFPVTSDGLLLRGAVRYKADVPGQRGKMWTEAEDGTLSERTLELDATGGLIWKQNKETGPVRIAEDGTVYIYFASNRIGYAVGEDGTVKKTVDIKAAQDGASKAVSAGVFKRTSIETERPAEPAQITAMMKEGPARVAAARMKRMSDWGTLAQMEGRHWTFFVGGVERIGLYQWTIPGQQMAVRYWNADAYNIGKPDPQVYMTHNPAKGAIDAVYTQPSGATTASVFTRGPQGESIETTGARKDIYTLTNAGEVSVQHVPPAGQQAAPLQVRRAMDNNMVQIAMERTRAAQQRIAQQQAAARAAEEEDDGDDFLGFLGTAVQAYGIANNDSAFAGAIGNAISPEVGSVLQGAANSKAGSVSGALSAGIDQAFANSLNQAVPGIVPRGTGGGPGVASLGGGGAANIRNFAMGPQCPGFTNENYRQHAFNGGNDQQLFSLCGQAFELFHMTQNAISQGYSEADWNRTYSAHKDAARVATDFYNKNR